MAGLRTPTLGACGLDCGLCPRYYARGSSRCPGCGGEGFSLKHPPCGFLTCCQKRTGLQVCAECGEYPCRRFDRESGARDSFVTHRRVLPNQAFIRKHGLEAFLAGQAGRMSFLETALALYDDGRSRNVFCLAAALLSAEGLSEALDRAGKGEDIRVALAGIAASEGQELKLRK